MSEQHVAELYLRLLKGWNDRDAAAMAACFSPHGTMIGFDGSLAESPQAIADHLSPIFADHPTAVFVAIIRSVRLRESAGVLIADAGMIPPGGKALNAEANARQTLVAGRGPDGWQIDLFQNTPAALHWDKAAREKLTTELTAAWRDRGPLPAAPAPS